MAYYIENGTLFIDAGEPYLEHHGVLGMKWGKHLRAGKGPASAPASAGGGGGGAPEEDEETKKKIEEAAKKAGMSVDDYRKKFADKVAEIKKAAYNAAGGNHKKDAAEYRKMSRDASNEARKYEASGNADLAKAASAKRKGNTSAHSSYKTTGDNAKDEARKARERALSNGPVEAKPKKGLGKRLEEKLGVTHETTNKPKQSKEAKRIEDMYKNSVASGSATSKASSVVYNIAGGRHKAKAERHRKEAQKALAEEQALTAKAHRDRARAASGKRKANKFLDSGNKEDHDIRLHNAKFVERRAKKTEALAKKAIKRRKKAQNSAYKEQSKYERSFAGRYDRRKAKRVLPKLKHFDDTNAIYTEGTRLVVNSKWG